MIKLVEFSSIFVANWKLNGNIQFIKEYYQKLLTNSQNCVVVCPPSIFINKLQTNEKNLFAGAQDVSKYQTGAYTGELSADMLSDYKVQFCLVGHSERREYFNEKNNTIRLKSINLIQKKIVPILCIGETLKEKNQNMTEKVLAKQLIECIPDISNFENTIIAYEPIWAIGTGLTPSLEEIDKVHSFIKTISKKFNNFKVLYGGSVNVSNSSDINNLKNVDGCLIGGASLKVNEFNSIIS